MIDIGFSVHQSLWTAIDEIPGHCEITFIRVGWFGRDGSDG
jgi:hypothetical protein